MSKKEINIKKLIERVNEKPANYAICQNMPCAKRQTCLHGQETTADHLTSPIFTCVNPREYADGRECLQYRDLQGKRWYALGARAIVEEVKRQGGYKIFMEECLTYFCRTVYFDVIAGKRLISPAEQQFMLTCAQKAGVILTSNAFDRMIEATAW